MTDHRNGLPSPQKYWALFAILLSIAMTVLESTLINIALPTLSRDMQITAAQSVWIVNTYQLAIVVAMLPMASLGEIFTYRRVFKIGLWAFLAASLGCALSRQFEMLIGFRVVQGLAAAAIMSVTPALLRFTYSQEQFGRAIGFNALIVAVAAAAGPILGSLVLSVASWPWLFALSIPSCLIILVTGARVLPATAPAKHPFDWISALLCAIAFGCIVTGADRLISQPTVAISLVGVGVMAGWLLVRRELPRAAPLLPLDLLRIKPFAYSIGASMTAFSSHTIANIALPFYFANTLGRSQLELGLLMMPWPIAVAIAAPTAGRLSERISPAILCSVGTGMVAAGMIIMALIPTSTPNSVMVSIMFLSGVGFGLFQTPNNRVMLTTAPRHRSGSAGGMQGTARQSGMALGAAITALAFTAGGDSYGATIALLVSATLSIASSWISTQRPPSRIQ